MGTIADNIFSLVMQREPIEKNITSLVKFQGFLTKPGATLVT